MKLEARGWKVLGFWLLVAGCGGESAIGDGGATGATGGTTGHAGAPSPSGGTSGVGGTTGGVGGTTGGTAGMTVGIGGTGGMQPIPMTSCDIPSVLTRNCALAGCHKPGAVPVAGGLNFKPDDGLVGRLKDVPAPHSDIYCGDMPCPVIPAECPVGDKFIDSANVEASWIIHKLTGPMGCGDQMPAGVTITAEDRACVIELVHAIAALP